MRSIAAGGVELVVRDAAGERPLALPNDWVFILAGGTPPFALLRGAGVAFGNDEAAAPAKDATASMEQSTS